MRKEKYQNVACPICQELPHIHSLYDDGDKRPGRRSDSFNEYKVSCPHHHLDCGDWKTTKLAAWKDWLKIIKDTTQPDFCYNDNHFTIQQMTIDDMADFLLRWQNNTSEFIDGEVTAGMIKEWLKKPVDGLYPKGYPGVPKELQSDDDDIYGYRKRQAKTRI